MILHRLVGDSTNGTLTLQGSLFFNKIVAYTGQLWEREPEKRPQRTRECCFEYNSFVTTKFLMSLIKIVVTNYSVICELTQFIYSCIGTSVPCQ